MRIGIILVVLSLSAAVAAKSADTSVDLFEREEKGDAIVKGTRVAAVGVGAAFGTLSYGGNVRHDWIVGQVQHGIVVSDLLGADRWVAGRLVLGGEFLFAHQYRPGSAVLFGATPLARYVFDTKGSWIPFVEGGMGIALTDIGRPGLGGTIQFSPQGGAGVYRMLKPGVAIGAQHRFIHYSNGSLRQPNGGINQHVLVMSLVRFY